MLIKCIAHRGYSSQAPENTLSAIELALKNQQIYGIEIDVQLTRDSIPVVIHDFVVDRVTDGNGFVKDYEYNDLKKLDAGSWFDDNFKTEKIPTLEEVLELIGNKKKIIIEIKSNGYEYQDIDKKVVKLIKEKNMSSEVMVKSFNHKIIKSISELAPDIETGLLISGRPNMIVEQVQYTSSSFISMSHYYINEKIINKMHKNGIRVMVWTVDEDRDLKKVKKYDNDLTIITNYPEKVIKYI